MPQPMEKVILPLAWNSAKTIKWINTCLDDPNVDSVELHRVKEGDVYKTLIIVWPKASG